MQNDQFDPRPTGATLTHDVGSLFPAKLEKDARRLDSAFLAFDQLYPEQGLRALDPKEPPGSLT